MICCSCHFFLRRVSEALGRFLFQQLVLALDFCHRRGKVCRGVKLANTLLALAPGQLPLVKLADFGFSKDVGQHGAPQSQVSSRGLLVLRQVGDYAGTRCC
jgi:serine/threonine-protein kinase SRK2